MDALYVIVCDTSKVDTDLIDKEKDTRPVELIYAENAKDPFETSNLEVAKGYAIFMQTKNNPRYPNIEYKVCKCIPIEMIGEA